MNITTAISISSNALQLIGHNAISSFDDQGAGATVAKAFYETSYKALLTTYPWNFAKKKKTLNRLTEEPLNEWKYQYQLPTDFLRVITSDTFTDWAIYGDKIYTNVDKMDLDYIYRVDESFIPPNFREALEFYLASKWAIPVTESATNAGVYADLADRALKKAKYVDGAGETGRSIKDVANLPYAVRRRRF